MRDGAIAVVPSEHDLVTLARGLVSFAGRAVGASEFPGATSTGVPLAPPGSPEVQALLSGMRKMHPVISAACEGLLGDALSHAWPALWRRGGTQPAASLDRGSVRRGRIWERHEPVGLVFSPATLRLLQWMLSTLGIAIAAMPLGMQARAPVFSVALEETALTVGDQVIIYLALDATSGSLAQTVIAAQPLVRAAPLAWLGFADVLGAPPVPVPGAPPVPAFDCLCEGAGAIAVEALGRELARRWRAVELSKRAITAPEQLIALGAAQDATLSGFLAACDRHRRRDLAGFVIDAAAPLLQREIAPTPARLDPAAPLARRAAARVAAGALLRAVGTWAAWDQAHRGVRFIDDDYPAAQLLLARFEAVQTSGAARAAAWLSELAALAPTTAGSAATVEPP